MTDLTGKVAVVTGGAQGIGRAAAERMQRAGARVAVLDVDEERGAEMPRELDGVRFVACDVTDERQVAAAMEEVTAWVGDVSVLVNNAGRNAYHEASAMTEQEWDTFFALDLKAAWLCAKHALVQMRRAGAGAIVNVASIHAAMTTQGMFPYAAAKAGMVGLTRSLALDCAAEGIRVNAVCPGFVMTRVVEEWLTESGDPAAEAEMYASQPMGRIGTPEEIANFIAFLSSDEAGFITGAALAIDGGLSARFAS